MTLFDVTIERVVGKAKQVETSHAQINEPGIHEAGARVDRDIRSHGWNVRFTRIEPASRKDPDA